MDIYMIDFKCSVTMPDAESASKLRSDLIEYATKGPALGVMHLAASSTATSPRHVSVEYLKAFRDMITASAGRLELTKLIIAADPLSIEILTCYFLEAQLSARLQERIVPNQEDADDEFLRAPISELFGESDSQRAMNITCILEANGIATIGELVRWSSGDIMSLHGIGGASLGMIREALALHDLTL